MNKDGAEEEVGLDEVAEQFLSREVLAAVESMDLIVVVEEKKFLFAMNRPARAVQRLLVIIGAAALVRIILG